MSDLVERLIERRLVTPQDVERAKQSGLAPEEGLVALGAITEDQVGAVRAEALGVPYVFPRAAALDADLVGRFPPELLRQLGVVPLMRDDCGVIVAAGRALDADEMRDLETCVGGRVSLSLASPRRIAALLDDVVAPTD